MARADWIEMLYERRKAGHALQSSFLLNLTIEHVAAEADRQENGRAELRLAAIQELESENDEAVALSLLFLAAAGEPEDLTRVEGLMAHPNDLVQRAARACRYQLRKRPTHAP